MPKKELAVRTLFLANFFEAAATMAEQRRHPTNPQELVNAMKRVEIADKTLEKELSGFAERGYSLSAIIRHPHDSTNPQDLLITAIFERTLASMD